MRVARRPGPDRRQRHQVGEVQGMDQRLAHVGVDLPRQAAQPGFDGIHGLADAGEAEAVDHALDGAHPVLDTGAVLVPNGDGGGQMAEADMIAAPCEKRPDKAGLFSHRSIESRRGKAPTRAPAA